MLLVIILVLLWLLFLILSFVFWEKLRNESTKNFLYLLNLLNLYNLRELSWDTILNNKWRYNLMNNKGYCFIKGDEMIKDIEYYANDFINYKPWYSRLGNDTNLNFRKRGYSRFAIEYNESRLIKLESKIFAIPSNENLLLKNKGRKFDEIEDDFIHHKLIHLLIWRLFDSLPINNNDRENNIWHVGLHAIRIISKYNEIEGLPTPEGIHQDGAQYVAIIFINKNNVNPTSAKNGIYNLNAIKGPSNQLTSSEHDYNNNECKLFECILSNTFDTILINDRMVTHDATPIIPNNINEIATRDMLIITFMHKQQDENTTYS